jgi:hypothetical protein
MIPIPLWTKKNGITAYKAAAASPTQSSASRRPIRNRTGIVSRPDSTDTIRIEVSGFRPSFTQGMPSQICSGSRPIVMDTHSSSSDSLALYVNPPYVPSSKK